MSDISLLQTDRFLAANYALDDFSQPLQDETETIALRKRCITLDEPAEIFLGKRILDATFAFASTSDHGILEILRELDSGFATRHEALDTTSDEDNNLVSTVFNDDFEPIPVRYSNYQHRSADRVERLIGKTEESSSKLLSQIGVLARVSDYRRISLHGDEAYSGPVLEILALVELQKPSPKGNAWKKYRPSVFGTRFMLGVAREEYDSLPVPTPSLVALKTTSRPLEWREFNGLMLPSAQEAPRVENPHFVEKREDYY